MRPALDPALAPPVPVHAAQPTHPCVRCGMAVPIDVALCERCNPLGLPQPASSQAHGTILLAIAICLVVMAVVGRAAAVGVGPFTGSVGGVTPDPSGLRVTITVRNDGTGAGSATCRVFDPSDTGIGPDSSYLLSPKVEPGVATTFSGLVTTLGQAPRPLGVDCR